MPVVGTQGYQHTLADLRSHVYACLQQDESSTHFKKARVHKWINQVFDEMRLAKLYSLGVQTFVTAGGERQTWVPPSNVWKIVGITYDVAGNDTPLAYITHDQFDRLTDGDWNEQSGDPQYWHDDGEFVWFDKAMPTGKVVKYWYWERAQEITSDSELSGFYKVFLPVVVAGVLAKAKLADDKLQAYQAYEAKFQQLITQAREHIQSLHEPDGVAQQILDHQGFV